MANSRKSTTKALKFAPHLIPLVLDGQKYSTWRIDDEKQIKEGDILMLCNMEKEEFARAKVIKVKITTFEDLEEDDMKGHERFNSTKEMLDTYSNYYNLEVSPQSELKIIKFKLI